ncbi:MAG: class I SAM-dependent methyltransferase [Candidatus Berkiellales bacterium]
MVAEKTKQPLWYQEVVGSRLIAAESIELERFLKTLYGYHLLFLGEGGLTKLVDSSSISHRILLDPCAEADIPGISSLRGDLDVFPLRTDSVDVVVLAHVLEHVANPHEILRETQRVLIPEGHIIISGFNPFSCWGIWHAYKKMTGKMPRQGKMLSHNRLKDWLTLLNFQIVGGELFYFRPPVTHQGLHQKLGFLEKWGQKFWPFLAGAYTLHAIKRVVPLTPIRARWRTEPIWQGASEGLPKPTTTTTIEN